jgi:hypothetical protein
LQMTPSTRQHTSAYVSTRQHTSAFVIIRQHTCTRLPDPSAGSSSSSSSLRSTCRMPLSTLYKALPRLYQGSIKALLRLYQGAIKALLRLF